jgi:sulfur relay (sulfurtransferase) DsrF/TusC family protein
MKVKKLDGEEMKRSVSYIRCYLPYGESLAEGALVTLSRQSAERKEHNMLIMNDHPIQQKSS